MPQEAATTIATEGVSGGHDTVIITLRVPADVGCRSAQVAGDFTAWVPVAMAGEPSGGFVLAVRLPRGRSWRYRFLVDGDNWMNDLGADDYVLSADGGAVSLRHT